MPSPAVATVRDDRRLPLRRRRSCPMASMVRRSRTTSWAPGRSHLFTTKMSAISRMPALAAWIESPMPGATITSVVSASDAISTSAWPDPDGLDQHHVEAGRVQDPQRLRRGHGQPAQVPAAGHRPDEHPAVGRVILHPHPVTEQRAAGERRGRVDREHADPQPGGPVGATSAPVTVDFPTPGEPVSPMHPRVARSCGAIAFITARSCGRAVLDQRDQPGQRPRVAVSGAAGRPAPPVARVGRAGRALSHGPGAGTRSSSASPWPPPPHSAAAPRPPPRRRSSWTRCSASLAPGRADRMAERDRAAVDVDQLRADAEVAHRLDGDRGERLVDLDQVQVRDRPPGLGQRAGRWRRRAGTAASCPGRPPCRARRSSASTGAPCGRGRLGGHRPRPRRRRRRSATPMPAVIVPSLANAGRSLASVSARGVGADALVGVEDHRIAAPLRHRHGARSPRRAGRS